MEEELRPGQAGLTALVIFWCFAAYSVLFANYAAFSVCIASLVVTLLATHREPRAETGLIRWALTVNPPQHVPVALNGFALWNGIVFVMMAVGYAYPIYQAIGPGALPVSVVVGGH